MFSTGQQLLSEALNALGFKDKVNHQEKLQVAINTLPWPRSEIVPLSTSDELGARKDGGQRYAVVSTEAFGASTLDPVRIQHQMVGRGATST